jgi:hypothetical protein
MAASHQHHSGLDKNDTASRIKHATGQGFERTIPAKHVFGTEDEIGHRVGGTFPSLPDRKPTNFRQLGPASAGGNANDRKPRAYSGNQKFGSPRRYA